MLIYTDYFKCVHKIEPGKKYTVGGSFTSSVSGSADILKKVFRNISKNVKAGTVHTLPDVQQLPTPGVPLSGYVCCRRACTLQKSSASDCSWDKRPLSHTNPAVLLRPSSDHQTQDTSVN